MFSNERQFRSLQTIPSSSLELSFSVAYILILSEWSEGKWWVWCDIDQCYLKKKWYWCFGFFNYLKKNDIDVFFWLNYIDGLVFPLQVFYNPIFSMSLILDEVHLYSNHLKLFGPLFHFEMCQNVVVFEKSTN